MATAVVMMLGGAIVNALAFMGSNFLFSNLKQGKIDAERKRHDLAEEQLSAAKDQWQRQRTKHLDFLNDRIRKQNAAKQTFYSVDRALQYYNEMTGENRELPLNLQHEPKLEDFYEPSDEQIEKELVFIAGGTLVAGYLTYKYIQILKTLYNK